MATKEKTLALGKLMTLSLELSNKRGGNQKLEKILGTDFFYKKGKYYFYSADLKDFTTSKLNKLSSEIKKEL